jgi:hypothetical protein
MANPEHLARLREGVDAWNEFRKYAPQVKVDLALADLSEMRLVGANLRLVKMNAASLQGAKLKGANLNRVQLIDADLTGADLRNSLMRGANLTRATLLRANLTSADLTWAKLNSANLSEASLWRGNLRKADLNLARLCGTDLRASALLDACLDGAIATGVKLWETQRAGWSIRDIDCECAFWDEETSEPTSYAPGEFERLYSDQTYIELFYQGGVSTFELNTLPALLQHIARLHPDTNIRLKSIEETGGGAKISISVGNADSETAERIQADAIQVYQAQLALRDSELVRLRIQQEYLEDFVSERLVRAMLTAGAPQNVFNAPVTGVVIAGGESKVDFHQVVNDNSAILALLEKLMSRYADLGLSGANAAKFQSELQIASTELEKKSPDKSILSKSIGLIQKLATEALTKAAGKLGESAATDWQTWLHQLGQIISHLK